MSSLYKYSPETDTHIRKFFIKTRDKGFQAVIYMIDKQSFEVRLETETVHTSFESLEDVLRDTHPRFILLNCPVKTEGGREIEKPTMIYFMPENASGPDRMLYVNARDEFQNKNSFKAIIDIETDEQELYDIEATLSKGE